VAQVIENLPSKCEALSSKPSTKNKKKFKMIMNQEAVAGGSGVQGQLGLPSKILSQVNKYEKNCKTCTIVLY
jgi:hypothetical protein